MRYLSVCSGIEAATVAWSPLGWKAVAFAEVEKFPSAVLNHHYPDVPNLGDMTKINGADFRGKIDVLVGGTPCQSFSLAGLRGGLNDERGNLALEFVRLADECTPPFIVWENVPGIFSDRGNAFGCFLAALAGEDAPLLPPGGKWADVGYVLGPRRTIAWIVKDAQYFGLAQRRRRVFLVASPGDRADPREILFESEGLRRDTPPGQEAETEIAGRLSASLGRSRGAGTPPGAKTQALTARLGSGGPDDNKAQGGFYVPTVAPTLNAGGNRTGGNRPFGTAVDTCESLVAFGGGNCQGEIQTSTTVTSHGRRQDFDTETFIAYPLRAQRQSAHDESLETSVAQVLSVRRLMPTECEALQGFPRDYTAIPWRGKPASECPDGPRYKALGNSMAVPVMRWIGERIARHA